MTYTLAGLDPRGVWQGTADPIVAMIPIDQNGIGFPDVLTVAVWRKRDWTKLAVAFFFQIPLLAGSVALGLLTSSAGWIVPVRLILMLMAWSFHRRINLGAHYVRVVGRYRTLTIRLDAPLRRGRRFHAELLRRCGMAPSAIP